MWHLLFHEAVRTLLVHKENKNNFIQHFFSSKSHIPPLPRVPLRDSARKEGVAFACSTSPRACILYMLSMQVIISLLLLYIIQNPFKEQLNHPSLLILKGWKLKNSDLNPWRKEVVPHKRGFLKTLLLSLFYVHTCVIELLYKCNIKLVARRYVCISARWDCLHLNHSRADKLYRYIPLWHITYRTSRVILLIYNGTIFSPQSFGVILRLSGDFQALSKLWCFWKTEPSTFLNLFLWSTEKTTCTELWFIPLTIKCHRNLFRLLLAPHFCTPHRVKSVCLRSWLADELMFPQCSDSDLVALGNSGGNLIPRLRFLNRIWCCLIPTEG